MLTSINIQVLTSTNIIFPSSCTTTTTTNNTNNNDEHNNNNNNANNSSRYDSLAPVVDVGDVREVPARVELSEHGECESGVRLCCIVHIN